MQQRGVKVRHAHAIHRRRVADLVGLAVDEALFEAAANNRFADAQTIAGARSAGSEKVVTAVTDAPAASDASSDGGTTSARAS